MEIKLQETEARGVYLAKIGGKQVVVALTERDRKKAEFKTASVTVSSARIRAGLNIAQEQKMPLYIAVSVSVQSRFNNSVAVLHETFKKLKSASTDFALGPKARAIFGADKATIEGARFEILPAPKPTIANEQEPAKLRTKAQAA